MAVEPEGMDIGKVRKLYQVWVETKGKDEKGALEKLSPLERKEMQEMIDTLLSSQSAKSDSSLSETRRSLFTRIQPQTEESVESEAEKRIPPRLVSRIHKTASFLQPLVEEDRKGFVTRLLNWVSNNLHSFFKTPHAQARELVALKQKVTKSSDKLLDQGKEITALFSAAIRWDGDVNDELYFNFAQAIENVNREFEELETKLKAISPHPSLNGVYGEILYEHQKFLRQGELLSQALGLLLTPDDELGANEQELKNHLKEEMKSPDFSLEKVFPDHPVLVTADEMLKESHERLGKSFLTTKRLEMLGNSYGDYLYKHLFLDNRIQDVKWNQFKIMLQAKIFSLRIFKEIFRPLQDEAAPLWVELFYQKNPNSIAETLKKSLKGEDKEHFLQVLSTFEELIIAFTKAGVEEKEAIQYLSRVFSSSLIVPYTFQSRLKTPEEEKEVIEQISSILEKFLIHREEIFKALGGKKEPLLVTIK